MFNSNTKPQIKTPLKSEPLWFRLDGVFFTNRVFMWAFEVAFSFLYWTKKGKSANFRIKEIKTDVYEPFSLFVDTQLSRLLQVNFCSLCFGVLHGESSNPSAENPKYLFYSP